LEEELHEPDSNLAKGESLRAGTQNIRRERRSAESVRTYIFEPYAQVILLGNSLIYFDDHLVDSMKGNIEDYLDQKTTVRKA
jgi:hypothetical protein